MYLTCRYRFLGGCSGGEWLILSEEKRLGESFLFCSGAANSRIPTWVSASLGWVTRGDSYKIYKDWLFAWWLEIGGFCFRIRFRYLRSYTHCIPLYPASIPCMSSTYCEFGLHMIAPIFDQQIPQ